MRKRGFKLIRKTLRWLHRKRGTVDIPLSDDMTSDSISKFILRGRGEVRESDGAFIGVGDYDSELDAYKLRLHIHGKNYLGGTEFCKIHSSLGITSEMKPSISDTQYIFVADKTSAGVPVIDSSTIKFKEKTAYTLAYQVKYISATKPRDLKLTFNYTDGTSYTPSMNTSASNFTECVSTDPEKTLKHISSHVGDRQITIYILANFGIYEGTHTVHADIHEPYVGERHDIILDAPLYSIGPAADELDLLSGKLTRKIKILNVTSSLYISETDTDGVFMIELGTPARGGSELISPYGMLTDECESGIQLSAGGSAIYFKPPGNLESVEKLCEYLDSNPFEVAYILQDPVTQISNAYIYLPDVTGKAVIDVLTEVDPKICYIEYY